MKRLITLLPFVALNPCFATHFLGGEIRYEWVTGLTYSIEARMYSCLSSPADRPEITIHFGDGTAVVPRTEIIDDPSAGCCGIRLSTYVTTHKFASSGEYTISYTDLGRVGGMVNVDNSDEQGVCIKATLIISPTAGQNASVRFETPQGVISQNWNTVIHDPAAYDADGDSLSFELVTPLGENCADLTSYQTPWADNLFWLDPATGVLLWDHPPLIGLWSIAIRCTEWRDGLLVGQVTRDMTICIPSIQVSVASLEESAGLTLSPTVAEDHIWLDDPSDLPGAVQILSSTGCTVMSFRVPGGRSSIDISTLGSGNYVVRSTAGDRAPRYARFIKP